MHLWTKNTLPSKVWYTLYDMILIIRIIKYEATRIISAFWEILESSILFKYPKMCIYTLYLKIKTYSFIVAQESTVVFVLNNFKQ